MQVITVTYERLYNLGNYENERLAATVTVGPDDPQAAFELAKATVVEQHARLTVEREEAIQRQREEYEERERQRRAELQRQREERSKPVQADTDEPPF